MPKRASLIPEDTIPVRTSVASCDGRRKGDGLGHPLVYLNMGEAGHAVCPYCRQKFIRTNDNKGLTC